MPTVGNGPSKWLLLHMSPPFLEAQQPSAAGDRTFYKQRALEEPDMFCTFHVRRVRRLSSPLVARL